MYCPECGEEVEECACEFPHPCAPRVLKNSRKQFLSVQEDEAAQKRRLFPALVKKLTAGDLIRGRKVTP